jgi:hypothetical protein
LDLQKLMDQFDISGAFDWFNSHRARAAVLSAVAR